MGSIKDVNLTVHNKLLDNLLLVVLLTYKG